MARTLSVPTPTPYGIKFQITVSSVSSVSSLSGCGVWLVVGHEEASSNIISEDTKKWILFIPPNTISLCNGFVGTSLQTFFHGNSPFVNTFKDVDFGRVCGLKNGLHCRGILFGAFHLPSSPGDIPRSLLSEHWDVNIYPDYTHSFNINAHPMDGCGSSSSYVLSGNINQRYMSSASLHEEEEVASDNFFSGCTPSCPFAIF